jgi:prefoldin alpha subunit
MNHEALYNKYKSVIQHKEQRLEQLQQKHGELLTAINAVKEFNAVDGERSALVSLVEGVFVQARVDPDKPYKINAGDGVVVDKDGTDVVALLEERVSNIESAIEETHSSLLEVYREVEAL